MKTFATVRKCQARSSPVFVHRLSPRITNPSLKAGHKKISNILRSTGIQAKLTIGSPGDKYEHEADRVAEQVMRMPDSACPECPEEQIQTKPIAEQITPLMQRQVEEEEEEEEIQAKLEGELKLQRQVEEEEEEEEPVQAKLINQPFLQCQTEEEEEEEEPVQAKANVNHTPEAAPNLASRIQAIRGGGQPLHHSERSFFEPRFGRDFSGVRIHTDRKAAETARAVNSRAFTTERDVVFGEGQFAPGTTEGRKLLGHELTHVLQQSPSSANVILPFAPQNCMKGNLFGCGVAETVKQVDIGGLTHVLASTPQESLQRQDASPSTTPSSPSSPRPVHEERFGVGRGGHRVDAELNRNNCWLTLKMKVSFNFVNTPEAWPSEGHKTRWQNDFIRTVKNRWSFRYFLVPDRPCPEETCNRVVARIQVIPVTSDPHFTLTVGYTTSPHVSSVSGRTATLDWLDTVQRADIPMTPAEHEFGHMLGLPHVRCNSSNQECYGVTSEEIANIMGKGSVVSPRDYGVFAEVMYYFNGCNWHAEP